MLELNSHFERAIDVRATPAQVYAVVADVPDSVAHFPDVESLVLEGGAYRWTLKKAGVGRLSMQLVYACRYRTDEDALTVSWAADSTVGNAEVSGRWTIDARGTGTRLTLHNDLVLRANAPRLLRKAAEPVFVRENQRLMGIYMDHLKKTFDGGNGRVKR